MNRVVQIKRWTSHLKDIEREKDNCFVIMLNAKEQNNSKLTLRHFIDYISLAIKQKNTNATVKHSEIIYSHNFFIENIVHQNTRLMSF
jgi:hypothetical protein